MIQIGGFIPQGWIGDLSPILTPVEQFSFARRVARKLDTLGFDSGWVFDHFHPVNSSTPTTQSVFECWTTLAAIAENTQNLRLGQMVTCNSYRQPAFLAKIAANLDVISNGRLEFGIGAGWYQEEYLGYGYPFPKDSVRIGMLGEAVQIILKMWNEESVDFEGKYYQLKGGFNSPKPVQRPHPPITIGGEGPKLTLRLVAQYADRSNVFGGPEDIKSKLEILRKHCEDVGRPFEKIQHSTNPSLVLGEDEKEVEELLKKSYGIYRKPDETLEQYARRERAGGRVGTPEEILPTLERFVAAGISYFVFNFRFALHFEDPERPLALFARSLMPSLRKMEATIPS